MTGETGILSFGCYFPKRRLQRAAIHAVNSWLAPNLSHLASGERASANWDEDTVTMSVEAARRCLSGFDRSIVDVISLASTTLPFADRSNATICKEALGLDDSISSLDQTGSQRAAMSQLVQALAQSATQLCLTAEKPKARVGSESEMIHGDAAAAILVGRGELLARVLGYHSVSIDFVDHFRAYGEEFDYTWEKRWIKEEGYNKILGDALSAAFERLDVEPSSIDHLLIAVPMRGVAEKLAMKLGISDRAIPSDLISSIGYSGSAHPLVMLSRTLEKASAGERVCIASFGQGADVLMLEATNERRRSDGQKTFREYVAEGRTDDNYMRFLCHRGLVEFDQNKRGELDEKQSGPVLARYRREVLGLIGGRSEDIGNTRFPKLPAFVDEKARPIAQADHPLSDGKAKVVTFTADFLANSIDPPTYYGMIDFDSGARMIVEFADVEPGDIDVGKEVRMVFRIKAHDKLRKFVKYFWKATPAN